LVLGQGEEALLKGRARYAWPPNTN
jgi:hypothetical protein